MRCTSAFRFTILIKINHEIIRFFLAGFDEDIDMNELKDFVAEANEEMSDEIIPKWRDLMMYGASMDPQDTVSMYINGN